MTWRRFSTADHVPLASARSRLLEGVPVAVARTDKGLFAFGALCPHQHADLSEGILEGDGIACPEHLWHFDLATGRCTMIEGAAVPVYPVREAAGVIEVDLP